jgi:cytochrome c553
MRAGRPRSKVADRTMKRWIPRVIAVGVGLAVAGFLVAATGIIPIKASSGHWAITEWFLRFSMRRSIATHSLGTDVPELNDAGLVLKGAGHYEFGCRSCHGAPGERQPRVAKAMLPQPPELVHRIRESDPKKLFHVVKHGLKFTGMPAWPSQQRDDEVWAMVAFLIKLPQLGEAEYRRLVNGEPTPTAPIQTLSPTDTEPQLPAAVNRTCVRCHGSEGLGRDSTVFPKLAGQRRTYMADALHAYASGSRHSGIMEPIAAGLSEEMIRELAEYYARLGRPAQPKRNAQDDAELIESGRRIANHGIPGSRVPPCVECHGPRGRRTKDAYPSLVGQPAEYLLLQLELFKNGQRGGSSYAHLMEEVAPRLKPNEMRAVAKYFESLPVSGPPGSQLRPNR